VQPRFFPERAVSGPIPDNPEGRKSLDQKARKPKPPPRPIEEEWWKARLTYAKGLIKWGNSFGLL
jgi:hypothetical protein